MADLPIEDLPSLGGMASSDILPVVDDPTVSPVTKKITRANFMGGTNVVQVVGTDEVQTMTNKTLTTPKINENVALTPTATELNILDGATATTAEINYLSGVTSAIQTQLNAKASLTGVETLTNKTLTSPKINENVALTATSTELNYSVGVTSAIQTQLNTKASLTGVETLTNKILTSPVINGEITGTFGGYNSSLSRQAIINGNFDVWQRGTSFTNPGNNIYGTDRWCTVVSNSGTLPTNIVHTKQALTPGDIPNSFYHYRIAPDGAGSGFGTNDYYELWQKIEYGTRFLCGANKKVTLSFYARASVAGKKLGIGIAQNYGTGGSPSAQEQLSGTSITLTSSWVKYTQTFTTNTLASKTFGTDNNDFLIAQFGVMWGATRGSTNGWGSAETFGGSGTIDIAQVQLCAGDVALPFQPKSYEEELRACQRYCHQMTAKTAYGVFNWGFCTSGTDVRTSIPLGIEMRINPTLTTSGNFEVAIDGGGSVACTSVGIADANTVNNYNPEVVFKVASGGLTNRHYHCRAANDANAKLIFDAEL